MSTHTYAVLEVTGPTFRELAEKLKAAGYQDAFHEGSEGTVIDLHGLAVRSEKEQAAKLTLDNEAQVFFYEQDFYVLSNFSAFNVNVFGRDFQTAEHAYHWRKFAVTTSTVIANQIRHARSAHDAFKIAEQRRSEIRKDWDDIRLYTMSEILWKKVEQHEYVRRKLLATGDRELIENSWRDAFWGWGENRDGKNMLGKLWMNIRAELRDTADESAS